MSSDLVFQHERVDDLQIDNLKIIQNPDWFCFGTDAVLLSDFASKTIKKDAKILDLCSGNGIIPILISSKSKASKIYGLEIQECVEEMAERSIKLNNLEDKITDLMLENDYKQDYVFSATCTDNKVVIK